MPRLSEIVGDPATADAFRLQLTPKMIVRAWLAMRVNPYPSGVRPAAPTSGSAVVLSAMPYADWMAHTKSAAEKAGDFINAEVACAWMQMAEASILTSGSRPSSELERPDTATCVHPHPHRWPMTHHPQPLCTNSTHAHYHACATPAPMHTTSTHVHYQHTHVLHVHHQHPCPLPRMCTTHTQWPARCQIAALNPSSPLLPAPLGDAHHCVAGMAYARHMHGMLGPTSRRRRCHRALGRTQANPRTPRQSSLPRPCGGLNLARCRYVAAAARKEGTLRRLAVATAIATTAIPTAVAFAVATAALVAALATTALELQDRSWRCLD